MHPLMSIFCKKISFLDFWNTSFALQNRFSFSCAAPCLLQVLQRLETNTDAIYIPISLTLSATVLGFHTVLGVRKLLCTIFQGHLVFVKGFCLQIMKSFISLNGVWRLINSQFKGNTQIHYYFILELGIQYRYFTD